MARKAGRRILACVGVALSLGVIGGCRMEMVPARLIGDLPAGKVQATPEANRPGFRIAGIVAAPRPVSLAAPTQYEVGTSPAAISLADFNNDGKLDAVTADYGPWWHLGAGASVLLGNGDGSFAPRTRYRPGSSVTPRAAATADFNGDGNADFAIGDFDGSTLAIFMGDGAGGFTQSQFSAVHWGAMWLATGDIDGDGRVDLAMANHMQTWAWFDGRFGAWTTSIYLNRTPTGSPWATFTRVDIPTGGQYGHNVKIGDLNGDGKADLLLANSANTTVRLGRADGTFLAPTTVLDFLVSPADLADLDGDGKLDLVYGVGEVVGFAKGNGNGSFGTPATYTIDGAPVTSRPILADLNADGNPEIVVGQNTGEVAILLGHGDGTFTAQPKIMGSGYPFAFEAGDLDGDGLTDLAYVGHLDQRLIAMLNTTVLDATPPTTTAALSGPAGNGGWYLGPVEVSLQAQDDSGVAATRYTIDGGPEQAYSGPFLVGEGRHAVSYWSVDTAGNVEVAHSLIVKVDSLPPAVSSATDPAMLWPPNGKLVAVTVSGTMADAGSGLSTAAYSVSDAYGRVQPAGNLSLDDSGDFGATFGLEAARRGSDMGGRAYTVTVVATDQAGNSATAATTVLVPHDMRR